VGGVTRSPSPGRLGYWRAHAALLWLAHQSDFARFFPLTFLGALVLYRVRIPEWTPGTVGVLAVLLVGGGLLGDRIHDALAGLPCRWCEPENDSEHEHPDRV
jgi:hypothetical protein